MPVLNFQGGCFRVFLIFQISCEEKEIFYKICRQYMQSMALYYCCIHRLGQLGK